MRNIRILNILLKLPSFSFAHLCLLRITVLTTNSANKGLNELLVKKQKVRHHPNEQSYPGVLFF